jgi:hypothetical protein
MAVETAQINLADLLTGRGKGRSTKDGWRDRGADPQVKPQLAALCASAVPDGNDSPGVPLRDL